MLIGFIAIISLLINLLLVFKVVDLSEVSRANEATIIRLQDRVKDLEEYRVVDYKEFRY